MNSRETQARIKREAVLNSSAFKMWYSERRHTHPAPIDPYQAYQTDKALRARQENLVNWKKAPNQVDIGSVDSPRGGREIPIFRKAPKPVNREAPPRKQEIRTEHKPVNNDPRKRPLDDEIKNLAERMSMKYGSPLPTKYVLYRDKGPFGANDRMQMEFQRSTGTLIGATAYLGADPRFRGPNLVTAAHEFGHLAHAGGNLESLKAAGVHTAFYRRTNTQSLDRKGIYEHEIAAWKLAMPFIKQVTKGKDRARGMWWKRVALESYKRNNKAKPIIGPNGLPEQGFRIEWGERYF